MFSIVFWKVFGAIWELPLYIKALIVIAFFPLLKDALVDFVSVSSSPVVILYSLYVYFLSTSPPKDIMPVFTMGSHGVFQSEHFPLSGLSPKELLLRIILISGLLTNLVPSSFTSGLFLTLKSLNKFPASFVVTFSLPRAFPTHELFSGFGSINSATMSTSARGNSTFLDKTL